MFLNSTLKCTHLLNLNKAICFSGNGKLCPLSVAFPYQDNSKVDPKMLLNENFVFFNI